MNILHRIVNASKELVFESPYGNKVHFQMGDRIVNQESDVRVKYWMELSPSTEIKVRMGRTEAEFDRRIAQYRDPDKSQLSSVMLHYQWLDMDLGYPWMPCEADESVLRDYMKECFDKIPFYYDVKLLQKYMDEYPSERLDSDHPLMEKLRQALDRRTMLFYDSRENGLFAFNEAIYLLRGLDDVVRRYGLGAKNVLSLSVVKYLLSKAI